jgi:hypothetical protein
MEGSLVAYKVFTNGSVLNASEINDNLMNQSVMVFSNSAARSAALTSPLAGMLTFLEDTGLYSSWNGSAWVALDVSLISSTPFTSSSSVNVDNVFSSNFQNYKVVLNLTNSAGAVSSIRLQYRVGGANETATQYYYGSFNVGSFNALAFTSTNQSIRDNIGIGETDQNSGLGSELNIYNPNTIIRTQMSIQSTGSYNQLSSSTINTTTQYTGFRIFSSAGNMTGNIRVYGLRD